MSRFIHPQHARGIRSPSFNFGFVKNILTDRQIARYAAEGRYGTEAQVAALAKKKKKPVSPQAQMRALLKKLLS